VFGPLLGSRAMHALLMAGAGSARVPGRGSHVSGAAPTTAERCGHHDDSIDPCPLGGRAHLGWQCQRGADAAQGHCCALLPQPAGGGRARRATTRVPATAATARAAARARRLRTITRLDDGRVGMRPTAPRAGEHLSNAARRARLDARVSPAPARPANSGDPRHGGAHLTRQHRQFKSNRCRR
jgi:hypothetical protein